MRSPFTGAFQITQKFGENPNYYAKFGLKGHEGLDLIPIGSDWSILALEDGVVVRDEDNPRSGNYGIYVTLWHPQIKKATQYCHLAENYVSINQKVKKGEKIGKMGATGNVTGAHLHLNLFEVDDQGYRLNRNNGYFGGVDPLPFLQEDDALAACMRDREKFWKERDEALEKIKTLEQRLNEATSKILTLQAQNARLIEFRNKVEELINLFTR